MPKLPLPKPKTASVAGAAGAAIRRRLESAFRLPDGSVVRTGSFHDIGQLPAPYSAGKRLEEVVRGFADERGFMTYEEAQGAVDWRGAAPAARGAGHSDLWLRARAAALRRHAEPPPEPAPESPLPPARPAKSPTETEWEAMPVEEARARAEAGAHLRTNKQGKFIGAPPSADTTPELAALRRRLDETAREGAENYNWYTDARAANIEMSGGDPALARTLAAGQAMHSPKSTPSGALGATLAQLHDALEVGPEATAAKTYSTKLHSRQFAKVLAGEPPERALGPKTRPFFRQTDPTDTGAGRVGVNDVWMARLYGYPGADPKLHETNHAFMTGENILARERAREWLPPDAPEGVGPWQASAWTGMKKDALRRKNPTLSEAELSARSREPVSEAMVGRTAHETYELTRRPGAPAGEPLLPFAAPGEPDPIYRALGAPQRPTTGFLGRFEPEGGGPTEYNPAFAARPPVSWGPSRGPPAFHPASERVLRAASGLRSVATEQESRAYHAVKTTAVPASKWTAAAVTFRQPLEDTAQKALYEAGQRHGLDVVLTGPTTATITGSARPEPLSSKDFRAALKRLAPELPPHELKPGAYVGSYDVLPAPGGGARAKWLLGQVPPGLGKRLNTEELAAYFKKAALRTGDSEQRELLTVLAEGIEALRARVDKLGYGGLPALTALKLLSDEEGP